MPGTVPPPPPPTDAADGSVVARLEAGVAAVMGALRALEAGTLDQEAFTAAAFEHGVVQEADALWLLDLEGGQWVRYDGVRLMVLDAESG